MALKPATIIKECPARLETDGPSLLGRRLVWDGSHMAQLFNYVIVFAPHIIFFLVSE